mgnify:CR=1 FL=1
MVSILSSAKKPRTSGASSLALFGFELLSSVSNRATDITLEGQEPILPEATKMTLIVPRRGLKEESLHGAAVASISLLGPVGPNGPTNSCSLL